MLSAMLGGALVLLGPAFLKTRFGVDEVVTTLLLNFIMLLFVSMLLEGPLKDPMGMGWPQSKKVVADARLPTHRPGQAAALRALCIAILAAVLVWVIQTAPRWAYEMRAVGQNSEGRALCRHARESACWQRPRCCRAALPALAGWSEVAGLKGNLTLDLSPGFGYTGIIVAMLALLHPLGVVVAAIFVAAVFVGADAMSRSGRRAKLHRRMSWWRCRCSSW